MIILLQNGQAILFVNIYVVILGPAAYMLPKVMGPFSVGKTSLPSYTMVSRRSYGSFHDDLQRVKS